MQNPDQNDQHVLPEGAHDRGGHEEPYVYKQADIRERHGQIPIWLTLVALGLIAWGIYYTIRYWSPD